MSTGPFTNGVGTLYYGTTATVIGMVSQDISFNYKNNVKVNVMDENGRKIGERQDDQWITCDIQATIASGSFVTPGNVFTVSSSLVGALSFICDETDVKCSNRDYVKLSIKGTNYQYLASGSL